MFRTTLATAACALALTGGAHAATVVIDDFSDLQIVVAPTDPGGVNPNTDVAMTGAAIGGTRTITNERTSMNAFITATQVVTVVNSGAAAISLPANVDGTSLFEYAAGGVDLTDGGTNDRIEINILSADQGGVVYTLSLDGVSEQATATAGGTLVFNFSDFGAEDGTDVDDISLLISGPTAFDTTFDFIGAVPSAVPLPAAGLLTIAGLGALGAARARRRK